VPRILDLLDAHGITMNSFMIGDAVRRHPEVAAEIVARGHEAGARGAAGNGSTSCLARRSRNGSPTA
jgi:peptidoglycan/xylan/chitin deacetylase (PgdA/CDA1 family)